MHLVPIVLAITMSGKTQIIRNNYSVTCFHFITMKCKRISQHVNHCSLLQTTIRSLAIGETRL